MLIRVFTWQSHQQMRTGSICVLYTCWQCLFWREICCCWCRRLSQRHTKLSYKYAAEYLETDTSPNEGRHFSERRKSRMPKEEKNQQTKTHTILWAKAFEDKSLGTIHKIKLVIRAVSPGTYTMHAECIQIFCILQRSLFNFIIKKKDTLLPSFLRTSSVCVFCFA